MAEQPKKSGDKQKSAQDKYKDVERTPGYGGETHPVAGGNKPILTTQQGAPVTDESPVRSTS
jgi:catalase